MLAELDIEHKRYRREVRRPRVHLLLADRPARLGTVEEEVQNLITDRFGSSHALYSPGSRSRNPACQRKDCDVCHRILALLTWSEVCETREAYRQVLNWIMDPEFLA